MSVMKQGERRRDRLGISALKRGYAKKDLDPVTRHIARQARPQMQKARATAIIGVQARPAKL